MKKAHVTHPELKVTLHLEIIGVKKNPNGQSYTQLGVLTKGTIIEVNVSELGLVTPGGKVVWGKYAQVAICTLHSCKRSNHIATSEHVLHSLRQVNQSSLSRGNSLHAIHAKAVNFFACLDIDILSKLGLQNMLSCLKCLF